MADIEWVNRCLIIEAALAPIARAYAKEISVGGDRMWTMPLGARDGVGPVTHYASSGAIDRRIADSLESPQALRSAVSTFGIDMPLEACSSLLLAADITVTDYPHARIAALNLEVRPFEPVLPSNESLSELLSGFAAADAALRAVKGPTQ